MLQGRHVFSTSDAVTPSHFWTWDFSTPKLPWGTTYGWVQTKEAGHGTLDGTWDPGEPTNMATWKPDGSIAWHTEETTLLDV